MRIGIIETGLPPEECQAEFGTYPVMIENWLKPVLAQADFETISIVSGEKLPENPAQFDAYVISGSRHGVYDPIEWIKSLEDFLICLRDKKIPVCGICFGHQIMAQAYGGVVEKSTKGWGFGTQTYQLDQESDPVLVLHQDQVVKAPLQAKPAGGNDFCPLGVLRYDFPAISVQFHPEFSTGYIADMAKRFRGSRFPEDIADVALASLQSQAAMSAKMAKTVAELFRADSTS
ncbi:type 1 glutamine amidotransferase [Paenochrobactrum sp. BZR 588]|uniref:type 1 glutamine amidotransferase n=1 Tax=unclassified Paenochrobactrum TaxID=2639760 RepID=UPI003852F1AE